MRKISNDIEESIEDQIVQAFFNVHDFISSTNLLNRYKSQLRIARRNGWSGRGLGHH